MNRFGHGPRLGGRRPAWNFISKNLAESGTPTRKRDRARQPEKSCPTESERVTRHGTKHASCPPAKLTTGTSSRNVAAARMLAPRSSRLACGDRPLQDEAWHSGTSGHRTRQAQRRTGLNSSTADQPSLGTLPASSNSRAAPSPPSLRSGTMPGRRGCRCGLGGCAPSRFYSAIAEINVLTVLRCPDRASRHSRVLRGLCCARPRPQRFLQTKRWAHTAPSLLSPESSISEATAFVTSRRAIAKFPSVRSRTT